MPEPDVIEETKPKVKQVDRKKNGAAERIIIQVEGKLIIFIDYKGRPLETARARLDGARIWGKESFWISAPAYIKAKQIAGAILHQRARRRSHI